MTQRIARIVRPCSFPGDRVAVGGTVHVLAIDDKGEARVSTSDGFVGSVPDTSLMLQDLAYNPSSGAKLGHSVSKVVQRVSPLLQDTLKMFERLISDELLHDGLAQSDPALVADVEFAIATRLAAVRDAWGAVLRAPHAVCERWQRRSVHSDKRVSAAIRIQALCRGWLLRRRVRKLREKERRRANVTDELVKSEKTYCSFLRTLQETYAVPLRSRAGAHSGAMLTDRDYGSLFGCVKDVLEVNSALYTAVVSAKSQKASLGAVMLEALPKLEASYIAYVNGYALAATALERLRQQPAFQAFETAACARTESGQRLDSLLIMPVQRLPRYELLLRELLDSTPSDHKDRAALTAAFEKAKQITSHVNESRRDAENAVHSRAVIACIEGRDMLTGDSSRRLVHEGLLSVSTPADPTPQTRNVFLFTDTLLFCTRRRFGERYDCRESLGLHVLTVRDAAALSGQPIFEINAPGRVLSCVAQSDTEKNEWLAAFAQVFSKRDRRISSHMSRALPSKMRALRQAISQLRALFDEFGDLRTLARDMWTQLPRPEVDTMLTDSMCVRVALAVLEGRTESLNPSSSMTDILTALGRIGIVIARGIDPIDAGLKLISPAGGDRGSVRSSSAASVSTQPSSNSSSPHSAPIPFMHTLSTAAVPSAPPVSPSLTHSVLAAGAAPASAPVPTVTVAAAAAAGGETMSRTPSLQQLIPRRDSDASATFDAATVRGVLQGVLKWYLDLRALWDSIESASSPHSVSPAPPPLGGSPSVTPRGPRSTISLPPPP